MFCAPENVFFNILDFPIYYYGVILAVSIFGLFMQEEHSLYNVSDANINFADTFATLAGTASKAGMPLVYLR